MTPRALHLDRRAELLAAVGAGDGDDKNPPPKPAKISPQARAAVKNGTVYIRVRRPDGGGSGSGPLSFNPTSLSFTSANGANPNAQNLTISANTTTSFTYSTSVFGGVSNWIVISQGSSGSANSSGIDQQANAMNESTSGSGATFQSIRRLSKRRNVTKPKVTM